MLGLSQMQKKNVSCLCVCLALMFFFSACGGVKVVKVPVPIPTFGLGSKKEKEPPKPEKPERITSREGAMVGEASWYGKKFHGRKTASGERFNMYGMTAAHPSLPFDTKVRVTNLTNHRSVIVRINDRGPFNEGRIIDVSYGVAQKLDFVNKGITQVRLEIL